MTLEDPFSAPAAWELVVPRSLSGWKSGTKRSHTGTRYSLASTTTVSSSGATLELTTGFNWYLNKWVRLQFNWEHAWFDNPTNFGAPTATAPTKSQHQDSLLTRLQFIF